MNITQGLNSAVAFSKSEVIMDGWGDLSAILRLNDQNKFDVRDGGQYKADVELEYIAGTKYANTMDVNIPAQNYSVSITPDGGSEYLVATDYVFRASADTLTTLSQLTIVDGLFGGSIGEVILTDNTLTDIELNDSVIPKEYSLYQNYPNPFNPSTKINYTLPKTSEVKILIYNSLRQKIKTLVNQNQIAGAYSIDWNGIDNSGQSVSSGIYFYKISAGGFTQTKKMVILQ